MTRWSPWWLLMAYLSAKIMMASITRCQYWANLLVMMKVAEQTLFLNARWFPPPCLPSGHHTDLNFRDAPVQSSLSGECYTVHIDTACTHLFICSISISSYTRTPHTYEHTYSYQYVHPVYTVWTLAHFFCIRIYMCVITRTRALTYSCTATIVHNVSIWESITYTVKAEIHIYSHTSIHAYTIR